MKDSLTKFEVSELTREQFKLLQLEAKSLDDLRAAVISLNETAKERVCFYTREGMLYLKWSPAKEWEGELDTGRQFEQIVVLMKCRSAVLCLAHDIPLSGHLGIEKTKDRILKNYYWPGIFKDVTNYVKSCQKVARKRARDKAPLVPSRISEELMTIFSSVGIPLEVLTDQGTNFQFELFEEVCKFLGIKKLTTSPKHPMCNDLCERFNGTLKSMLRKFAYDDPGGWDTYLPYLLFAYREVPQSSTGFSPFELIYSHVVKGPIDILRDSFDGSGCQEQNMIQYVLEMREKLNNTVDVAQEHLSKEQCKQKKWYDKQSRILGFKPNEEVLVLLPTSASKLTASWQGPHKVIRKVGAVDYEIKCGGRRGTKVVHVNMLRRYVIRAMFCNIEVSEENFPDCISRNSNQTETWENVEINTAKQKEQLTDLLQEFGDVFTDVPGRTDMIQHDFKDC